MRISEAKECIKELYLNTDSVTALVSERGVGKTSAYKQCADELKIGYIDLYAAALEGPDFMGLPVKDIENSITKYLAPQFLPTKQAIREGLYPESGILVLEEINRVPSDTISVLYPLLLDRKINGHQLGDGWRIGVTMNPDTMSYLVNSLDDAMIDRFISISVTPYLDDYIEYSEANNANEEVLDYLRHNPNMLLVTNRTSNSSVLDKSPTPRGWTKVQEIVNQINIPSNLLRELISGIVGPIAAASYTGFCTSQKIKIPSANKIVTQYITEQNKVKTIIENNQLSVLTNVIDNVVSKLEAEKNMIKEVEMFINDLPSEMKILFYKVLTRDKKDMIDYYTTHSKVFEEISNEVISVLIS